MGWLGGILPDLRPGEGRLAVLMSANYFLLLLFYYLLKPARDSLFLVEISPAQLPLVYVLTALVAAPVTAAYARAGLKYRLDRLISLTTSGPDDQPGGAALVHRIRPGLGLLPFLQLGGGGRWADHQPVLAAGQRGFRRRPRPNAYSPCWGWAASPAPSSAGEVTGFLISTVGLPTQDCCWSVCWSWPGAGFFGRLAWRRTQGLYGPAGGSIWRRRRKAGELPDIIRSIAGSRHSEPDRGHHRPDGDDRLVRRFPVQDRQLAGLSATLRN